MAGAAVMKASLINFMTGLIDYAGLFPPAGLDIDTAVRNYAGYLASEEGWMLGRCIIPASRLHRVVLHPGFRCSVIVSPAVSQEELDQLGAFKGCVEMVEVRLPDIAGSPDRYSYHLLQIKSRLRQAGLQDVQLFIEGGNVEDVAIPAAAIATFNSSRSGKNVIKNVGYKLRCGGLEKQAFPSPEKVAEVISSCREHDIPIKFTAGMHHPLRNHAPDIEVMQHGFINIFGAALLCWGYNLSTGEIAECLRDEIADHFHFTEEGFFWKKRTISTSEIKRLRQGKVISFGSCSFTEPLEGLRSLGFLGNSGA
jgi:hypothetical protein